MNKTTTLKTKAAPFVKWVGGKRGIINELMSGLPDKIQNYYEPFVGGGALFFNLQNRFKKGFLSDLNIDLITTYKIVKEKPDELIQLLKDHEKKHNEKHYYETRAKQEQTDSLEIAARFIYLNKTCYNGLYRVNKKGGFNVPIGRQASLNIVQEDLIKACSRALKSTKIEFRDFSGIQPKKYDFVYFDPPYHPVKENSFTDYTNLDFTGKDQKRLRDFALSLHKKGVNFMISNSNTPFIHELYKSKNFYIKVIKAPRMVNCKSNKRNPAEEVLITNS